MVSCIRSSLQQIRLCPQPQSHRRFYSNHIHIRIRHRELEPKPRQRVQGVACTDRAFRGDIRHYSFLHVRDGHSEKDLIGTCRIVGYI